MAFWSKTSKTPIDRLSEERVYELVLEEIESGVRRGGLWLKAIENSRGDEREAKLLYIRYRVQAMKDELALSATLVASEAEQRRQALNGYNADGYTPLMKAVLDCDVDRVISLLASGADRSLKENNFRTSTASDMAHFALSRASNEEARHKLQRIVDALNSSQPA